MNPNLIKIINLLSRNKRSGFYSSIEISKRTPTYFICHDENTKYQFLLDNDGSDIIKAYVDNRYFGELPTDFTSAECNYFLNDLFSLGKLKTRNSKFTSAVKERQQKQGDISATSFDQLFDQISNVQTKITSMNKPLKNVLADLKSASQKYKKAFGKTSPILDESIDNINSFVHTEELLNDLIHEIL